MLSRLIANGQPINGQLPEELLESSFSKPLWQASPPLADRSSAPPVGQPSSPPSLSATTRDPAAAEYLTVKEVGDLVHLHEKVIRRAIEAGELPAAKIRSRVRIRRADVDAWLAANTVEPSPHDLVPLIID